MTAAAIFDLDRTLIPGPSGPVFQRALVEAGVSTNRPIPGIDAFYRVYETFGENLLAMQAARLAVRGSKGWSVEGLAKASEAAADELEPMVQPYARVLIEEHHAAGRRVAIATTTPEVLVRAFAKRLGIDDVIATRWANDGRVLHRPHRGQVPLGQGEARRPEGVGRRERHRP